MTADGEDGRCRPRGAPATTPRGHPLVVPTRQMADAIANDDDERKVALGIAYLAIDRTEEEQSSAIEVLVREAAEDLLLYPVEEPEELVRLQHESWDPVRRWAGRLLGADLRPVSVIRPASFAAAEGARRYLRGQDGFRIVALEAVTRHTDSLLLGIGLLEGMLTGDEAWNLSIIEASWQESKWGRDEEAHTAREQRRREYSLAAEILRNL